MSAEVPRALPDVAIGRHPDHGIVADLPTQSAAAQWMLERLEFQRVPGHPTLYALTDQHREPADRTAFAVKLLNGAGYRVDTGLAPAAGPAAEPARTRTAAPAPPRHPDPDPGPDVAFAEHPRLGVVAAVGGSQPLSPAVFLEVDGWRHHQALDIYLAPPAATPAQSLDAVARTTVALQRGNYQVALQPQLAEAVAARRAPADQAFTTHKFRVNEAALAKSPAARSASPAKSAVPTAPPPAAVDPRIAFARAR
ncbi:hypothetical protein PUR71_28955 [Streptomyces sp. SP17BM10]|uniref:hypothetical protein n=1 Tax=Streptomyces sp. SP17BM10 TaxID=3002530 RepID=UPI002E796AB6|nr:hypothetical protein [Streptomyces sp. SP17BM10]MEE1786904.1 hypothetical protein [Streptomyces sp. SP17BM10]